MNKKMWKKIYGQCRMWINAREITLDPVPFMVHDDGNYAWVDWFAGKYFIQAFIGYSLRKIYINRASDLEHEVIVRQNA